MADVKHCAMGVKCCCMGREEVTDTMLGRRKTLRHGCQVLLYGQRRGYEQNACHVKYFAVDVMCCCMGREEVTDTMLGRRKTLRHGCQVLLYGQRRGYGHNAWQT